MTSMSVELEVAQTSATDQALSWRIQLLNRLILLILVVGIPLLTYALVMDPARPRPIELTMLAVMLALWFARHGYYRIRAAAFCALLFTLGTLIVFNNGMVGTGYLYLTMSSLFSAALLDRRFSLSFYLGSILAVSLIAWAAIEGQIEFVVQPNVGTDPGTWILFLGSFSMVSGIGVVAAMFIIGKMEEDIQQLQLEVIEKEAARDAELTSSQNLKFITENATDVIWTMDLDGNFTYVSPAVERLHGYTVDEVVNLGISLAGDDSESLIEQITYEIANVREDTDSHVVRIETTVTNKSGEDLEVELMVRLLRDEHGDVIGLLGVTRDIQDRKRLEAAMSSVIRGTQRRIGSDFFDSLTENLATVLDLKTVLIGELQEDGTVKTISVWDDKRPGENFVYELAGTPCEGVLRDSVCSYKSNVEQLFPEDTYIQKQGIDSYLGAPILDDMDRVIGVLVCMDTKPMANEKFAEDLLTVFTAHISAEMSRRQIERDGEITRKQLIQSQKLESIGQLAGGVAHDFNNLLVVIQGYVDLADDLATGNSELTSYHQQIRASADRAAGLTRQLLSFSRRQIMDTRPLNLNELLENLGGFLARLLPENINYKFTPGPELGTIEGDAGQLEQAVMNLAINARDAMPDGGFLRIETKNILIDRAFVESSPWVTEGEYVMLTVTDTGIGIPEEVRDRVFEPFFTTKPEGQGTGLGLSVLFGVIKQHSGFTYLTSEVAKGTQFQIYLPVVKRDVETTHKDQTPLAVTGDETLLLVEDDKQVRQLASMILTQAGYHVIEAEDGEIAVELFRQHAETISLVVLDVVLPKMGGREVLEEIRKISPEIPVLFVSGYAADGIHTNFILEDKLVLLQKPYTRTSLLGKVREMIEA